MKRYEDLTAEEIQKLTDIGMLETLYPQLNVPKVLEVINLQPLINQCNHYLKNLHKEHEDNDSDSEYYIYETVLNVLYGDKVWDFINKANKNR